MKFDIEQSTYINKNLCGSFEKWQIYLFYVSQCINTRVAQDIKSFLPDHIKDIENEDFVIKSISNILKNTQNVSELSSILPILNDTYGHFPDVTDLISNELEIKKDVNFSVFGHKTDPINVENISNSLDPTPNKVIVWEINRISPILCGLFFENMISHVLGILDTKYSDNIVENINSNATKQEIDRIYEVINTVPEPYNIFLRKSLEHCFKKDLNGSIFEESLGIKQWIENEINRKHLDVYMKNLSKSTFIKQLRKHDNLQHSIYKKEYIKGEVDFVSDSMILDIKSYKEPDYKRWYFQLNLYDLLFKNNDEKRQKIILNVYENKLYYFNG